MQTARDETHAFYADRATDVAKLDDRMHRLVEECVRAKPQSVIDLGCGRGFLLRALERRLPGLQCFGVELSDSAIDEARANGITVFHQSLSTGLPLGDETVDLAVMGEVIEHLFDPDACIEEVRRVMRPGGTLIVTTPNLVSWLNRGLVMMGIQPIFSETSTRKKYGHWLGLLGQGKTNTQGHLKLFTLGALRELLKDLGFDVERVEGYKFYLLAEHPVANVIESIFRLRPTLASGFIVTARKPLGSIVSASQPSAR
jgi:SAM-dependent methyltransferase